MPSIAPVITAPQVAPLGPPRPVITAQAPTPAGPPRPVITPQGGTAAPTGGGTSGLTPAPRASAASGILAPTAPPTSPPPMASSLPESGPVEALSPQQATELQRIGESLEALDYFQVLHLNQAASPAEIKKAFYRWSRIFHPDRYFHIVDGPAKVAIGQIYKRVTEAYSVLKDGPKRGKYLSDITGASRDARLRYTEATESELKAEAKKAQEEEIGTHPKARGFYTQASKDFSSGNYAAAQRNLKMAMTYEPSNKRYQELLADTLKKLDDERQKSGSAFKIK